MRTLSIGRRCRVYQAIAQVMLVDLLRWCPNETVRRKVCPQSLKRLPSQQNCAIGRFIKICPEERSAVPGNLRGSHEPLCDLVHVDSRHRRISIRGDEVDMGHLGTN